ncbi:DUF937 domain-containing protein [Microvirga antarctica]|uniref:DUF937 domain-containing protein n=1 Tax=Microvirga antarctica TaxID=2819233 RepID=UPI001B309A1D|nr:DUF937 domain-containing protein [Microvirga antarctica]
MFDWFDFMRQAQMNAATALLGRQFNVSGDQAQRALAAFLPAFAMGMQHTMGAPSPNPMMAGLFGGAYQSLWLNGAQAFSPDSRRNGEQILDQLFGSDDVSRKVAQQAASVTGVNADVMRQMLPVLAGIYAGGLYHWLSGQTRAMSQKAEPAPSLTPKSMAESWSRLCTAWTGAAPVEAKPEVSPFEAMMAGFKPAPADPRERHVNANAPPAWEDMMEKGRDLQKQYLASLQAIFDEAQKAGADKS